MIDELIEDYSKLFDVDPEVLSECVNYTFNNSTAEARLGLIPERKLEIDLSKSWSKRDDKESTLKHEYRHVINFQIQRFIIENYPEEYKKYLADQLEQLFINEKKPLETLLTRVQALYKENNRDLPIDHPDILEKAYHSYTDFLKKYRRFRLDLSESFADDGTITSDTAKQYPYLLVSPLYPIAVAGISLLIGLTGQEIGNHISSLISIAASIIGVNLIFFQKNTLKEGSPILEDGIDYSINTLEKYPVSARKYLVAFPPERGTTLEDHIVKLKSYGFPIEDVLKEGVKV